MLKPDRFSCSQKIQLKWDPPVLTSWRSPPFQTHTNFPIEILWTIFTPIQYSSIDLMLTEDSYQSTKIFNI